MIPCGSTVIRPSQYEDIPAISRVHVASWRTAYRGIIADSFLEALGYQKHEERHRRYMSQPGTVHFVAESPQAGIVGFAMGGPERSRDIGFAGELYAIYILDDYCRHGIGSLLVQHWAASMLSASLNSGLVWVLEQNNPAVNFYQRLGAKHVREQAIEIGGSLLNEVAYGWDDLNVLARR